MKCRSQFTPVTIKAWIPAEANIPNTTWRARKAGIQRETDEFNTVTDKLNTAQRRFAPGIKTHGHIAKFLPSKGNASLEFALRKQKIPVRLFAFSFIHAYREHSLLYVFLDEIFGAKCSYVHKGEGSRAWKLSRFFHFCSSNTNIFSLWKSDLAYSQTRLRVDSMLSTDSNKFIFALLYLEKWTYSSETTDVSCWLCRMEKKPQKHDVNYTMPLK